MNRYVVLARFDKNTEEKLIALRREMTNAGYASSEWPPHITLAAYEDLDAEALRLDRGVRPRAHAPKAGVRLCEPSAAVCHAPRNRRAVPEPGTRKAFCRFLLCVPRKIRVVLQRHRQLLRRFGGQARHPLYAQRCAHHGAAGRARARLPKRCLHPSRSYRAGDLHLSHAPHQTV